MTHFMPFAVLFGASSGVIIPIVVFSILVIGVLIALAVFTRYFRLWIQCVTTRAQIGILDLLGMTFRKVNPTIMVRSKIMAVQAGLDDSTGITSKNLEAHYLAGGNVPLVIRACIAAVKAKIVDLDFKQAAAIDLAGRNVLEAVQTSVYPKVIDCPGVDSGRQTLDAEAKDGIQLKVKARVTVRANLNRLIGGATEETIIARVGEGIVSAIGSAASHKNVLENPDTISKAVLARRMDAQTAYEIVSIDIADIDVGTNIGARLQADQAEADMRVAQARAEGKRAMEAAKEQENIASIDRVGHGWLKRRLKCRKQWPMLFEVRGWASWTITSCVISRPIPKCAKVLRVTVRANSNLPAFFAT